MSWRWTTSNSKVLRGKERMDTLRGENRVRFTKGLLQSMDIVHEVLFALFKGVRLTPIRQVGHKFRKKLT